MICAALTVLKIIHYSLFITHHPSSITHHPSPITHHPSSITHYSIPALIFDPGLFNFLVN
jgi:hypothetical protein